VKADNQTMMLNGTVPVLSYGISGYLNGETFGTGGANPSGVTGSAACTTANGTAIGTFGINCAQGSLTAQNYDFPTANFSSGTLTVVYVATGTCNGDANHTILQPVNPDGTSVFKQGSTVPAKFRVCDAKGVSIGTPGVVSSFKQVKIINGTDVSTVNEDAVSTTPDTAFRWDTTGQQWIFNLNTKSLNANKTYVYLVTLNDGSTITFQFGLK
jgi:hypothetical protein